MLYLRLHIERVMRLDGKGERGSAYGVWRDVVMLRSRTTTRSLAAKPLDVDYPSPTERLELTSRELKGCGQIGIIVSTLIVSSASQSSKYPKSMLTLLESSNLYIIMSKTS